MQEHELVEVYLTPLEMDASDEEGLKQLSGMVKACDHGLYQLSYTVKEQVSRWQSDVKRKGNMEG